MKIPTLMYILLMCIFACAGNPQTENPQAENVKPLTVSIDTKTEWHGVKWGGPVAPHFVREYPNATGVVVNYKHPSDGHLGSIKTERTSYGFFENQLYYVRIVVDSLNSSQMLSALQGKYGEGRQPNSHIEEYYWSGDTIRATYNQNSITGEATVWYFHLHTSDLHDKGKKAAAVEAAQGL